MLSDSLKVEIASLIDRYPSKRAALITALHALQREKGHLAVEDFVDLAEIFGEHPAEVQSVASFYSMFRFEPPARCRIEVCTNVSCMLRGSGDIVDHLKKKLGIDFGETTLDGLFSLEEVECLAACDMAPVIAVNGEYMGPMTVEKVDALIEEWRRANAGPVTGRA
jgi:NADH-quinone oxidoreductase subunit E